MIEYKDVVVPAFTRQQAMDLACDMCGEQSPTGPSGAADGNWTNSSYEFDRITIQRSEGTSFPEGGSRTTTSYDCCPTCWQKICALFKTGPRTEESDY